MLTFAKDLVRPLYRSLILERRLPDVDPKQFVNHGSKQVKNLPEPVLRLKAEFPWPDKKPRARLDPEGWFADEVKVNALIDLLGPSTKTIMELGSWLGTSTRLMLNSAVNAVVIAIDHWQGSVEHQENVYYKYKLPRLYDTFLVNCWDFRERLIPLKMDTMAGMKIVFERGIKPDLILVDADHSYAGVLRDIAVARTYFPDAMIVGDDFHWNELDHYPVKKAVEQYARGHNLRVEIRGNFWRLHEEKVD
ncbi:MAG: class I SAM-dependent methyltransferase [Sedimentisphaerales bacterium]|nr:class I SAM-dependent methyltransferase [Sedimentisphaerales bacterium]